MISSIRGEVLHVALDHAVVEVSGFGLEVTATPQTLAELRVGAEARLQTSFVPRQDDAPLLFGFADAGEREIFTTLLSISGVGPRLALAVLSVHSPAEVRQAIAESDTAAFTKVPGIGRRLRSGSCWSWPASWSSNPWRPRPIPLRPACA